MGLLDCIASRWQLRIGDPGLAGWLIVGACAAVAVLALRAACRGRDRFATGLWAGICAGLVALAINTQADLHVALTALGRCMAQAQGWFDARRLVQMLFVLGLAAICLLMLIWLWRRSGPRLLQARVLCAGCLCLAGFVGLRAGEFYHVLPGGAGAAVALQLSGLVLIGWAAWRS